MIENSLNRYIEPDSCNKEEMKALDFIKEKSQEIAPEFIEIRRKIHQNPELGFQEFKTAELVAGKLREIGLDEIQTEIGGTGVIGILKGKKEGKTIALRADMDALSIEEDPNSEFASKNPGKMHACGHDAHTSALLGTAEILKELRDKKGLDGDVIFIFQPNEEKTENPHSGSIAIIKHLYKKDIWQKVDAVFACHVQGGSPVGTVRLKKGLMLASSSRLDFEIITPGGHAARVHEVANPVAISSHIISQTDREFNPQKPQEEANKIIVNDTFIESEEPHTYNVVPKSTRAGGTIRISEEDNYKLTRKRVLNRIKQIIEEKVAPWRDKGASYKLKFILGTRPVVHRDARLVDEAEEVCKDVLGEKTQFIRKDLAAGEDFSFYLEGFRGKQIPGIMLFVGATNPEKGIPLCAHHNKKFKIDESVITQMSALMAEMARRELSQSKKN